MGQIGSSPLRGEHVVCTSSSARSGGSSPLARGTRPAVGPSPPTRTVHPRWRGEHGPCVAPLPNTDGSSPLARGILGEQTGVLLGGRFIPADAGNTARCPCRSSRLAVHPRWRGEHDAAHRRAVHQRRFIPAAAGNTGESFTLSQAFYGSSPLARGTHQAQLFRIAGVRFIPAGAGNTSWTPRARSSPTVHPRWRGEHSRRIRSVEISNGSSPLARGTRHLDRRGQDGQRFIPASAGNTTGPAGRAPSSSVHPRWRGEHEGRAGPQRPHHRVIPAGAGNALAMAAWACVSHGSSPLARGTRDVAGRGQRAVRFIPAGAGNTAAQGCGCRARTVHPSWRGEHLRASAAQSLPDGSSPLARGTRGAARCCRRRGRFIPAGAGNTPLRPTA